LQQNPAVLHVPIVHLDSTMLLMGHTHALLAFLVLLLIFLDQLHAMTSMNVRKTLATQKVFATTQMVVLNANVYGVTMEMDFSALIKMSV
jgi:hypothetical protein